MTLEATVLPDHWFPSPPLAPEDSPDLGRQCNGGNVKTWWGRLWEMLFSLVRKTENKTIRRTGPASVKPTSTATDTELLNNPTDLMQTQPDSQTIRLGFESKTSVRTPPPLSGRFRSTSTANDAALLRFILSSPEFRRPKPHSERYQPGKRNMVDYTRPQSSSLASDIIQLSDTDLEEIISRFQKPLPTTTDIERSGASQKPGNARPDSATIPGLTIVEEQKSVLPNVTDNRGAIDNIPANN